MSDDPNAEALRFDDPAPEHDADSSRPAIQLVEPNEGVGPDGEAELLGLDVPAEGDLSPEEAALHIETDRSRRTPPTNRPRRKTRRDLGL